MTASIADAHTDALCQCDNVAKRACQNQPTRFEQYGRYEYIYMNVLTHVGPNIH
jgi:hypothetical protein